MQPDDGSDDIFLKARRERIATAALQGLLTYPHADCPLIETADLAVSYANALIAALDEDTP